MEKSTLLVSLMLIVVMAVLAANILVQFKPSVTSFYTATPTGVSDINVSILEAVSIVINTGSQINFGSLYPSDSNTTQAGTGIILENNGSYDVNITATSDKLFTSSNAPAGAISLLSCKATSSNGGTATFWQSTYADCYNTVTPKIIGCLSYSDSTDEARVDLNITVPTDETAGLKQGQVTFTASGC